MTIVYDRHENALQVPRSAVIEESGVTSVFVVEGNVAVRKLVQTGFSNNGLIEISEGLVDDDRVITVGQIGLKPDANLTVINEPDDVPAVIPEDLNAQAEGSD